MPDDAPKREDVRAWLAKAALDLRAADVLSKAAEAGLWGDVTFHAQQAADKALKAFLAWHDQPFRKTHSIEELGRACVAIAADLEAGVDAAVPLTEYAWRSRYPGDSDEPTQDEAERAIRVARDLVAAIEARVPPKRG